MSSGAGLEIAAFVRELATSSDPVSRASAKAKCRRARGRLRGPDIALARSRAGITDLCCRHGCRAEAIELTGY